VISHAVTKGLDHTVPMKDSGVEWLGEVPAHWRAVRLRHCLVDALAYGANEPSDEANLEHPRYIRITDLNDDGTLSAETYKSLPPDKAEPYMLEQGDVLFARSGATVGKSFLYSREYGPACYAGYLIRARVNKRALIPMYLWMCTQSRQYEQFIGESNIQATIQNVSAEKYGNMWIALPEIEEQEKILAELETQLSQFESLVETSVGALVLLQERRSALISAAVTGKIDVRGWQPPASAPTPELAQEAV
jgi:type I restriction enzyme S subunit